MDNTILKKKLSTYETETGRLQNVSDDLLWELLISWEQWPGNSSDFYKSIGYPQKKLAFLLGKAKKLKREGYFPAEEFKEIQLESSDIGATPELSPCSGIELVWKNDKIIRFPKVDQLIDFLKKAA